MGICIVEVNPHRQAVRKKEIPMSAMARRPFIIIRDLHRTLPRLLTAGVLVGLWASQSLGQSSAVSQMDRDLATKSPEIHWPSGAKEEVVVPAADRIYTVTEGKGLVQKGRQP